MGLEGSGRQEVGLEGVGSRLVCLEGDGSQDPVEPKLDFLKYILFVTTVNALFFILI